MVDALLVFSPLQEICFFVLRSPYFDRIGVAPLLRRRLVGFQRFYSLLVSPSTSPRLVFCPFRVLLFLPYGNLYNPLAFLFALAFRLKLRFCQASYATSLRTYLLSFYSYEFLIRKSFFCKTSSAVAYLVLLFIFTKN
jgi:hypothetical protein